MLVAQQIWTSSGFGPQRIWTPLFCSLLGSKLNHNGPNPLRHQCTIKGTLGNKQDSHPYSKTNFKDFSRTFAGSRLIFPRLQISPHSLSFPRFQNKFSLRSTYISYKVNSEIFIARVSQISRTFQNLQSFFKTFESWKMSK